jgi:hypothetical protein
VFVGEKENETCEPVKWGNKRRESVAVPMIMRSTPKWGHAFVRSRTGEPFHYFSITGAYLPGWSNHGSKRILDAGNNSFHFCVKQNAFVITSTIFLITVL